jgi:hypothetical protein
MIADAQQYLGKQRIPTIEDQAVRRPWTNEIIHFEDRPLLDRMGTQSQPRAGRFLLVMAAFSVAREAGGWILGDGLEAWFGLALDPFAESLLLQSVVALLGLGVAAYFAKGAPDAAARRHMHVTLLASLGIGLLLALLSHFVGYANALSWPLIPVYLLWAWAEVISGPCAPMTSPRSAQV